MKKLILFLIILLIIVFFGKNLNPFSNSFFTFHDETQPARITQFTKELKSFHWPPRIAPDMNFAKGYPLFNFYAPFPYFFASFLNLLGFGVINCLKLSFLTCLLIAFIGSFLFFKNFFGFYPATIGGLFYISSLYFPLDIFVRGNLGEIWFLSLLPIGLYYLVKSKRSNNFDKKIFLTKTLFLAFILTSHNIYSLFFIPVALILIFTIKNNWQSNLLSLTFAFLLTSFFWFPAGLEMNLTYAKEVAEKTDYKNHFLCVEQLWQSTWGYGGSTAGCFDDGMAFKIGKLQLIFFTLGMILLFFKILSTKNFSKNKFPLFMGGSGLFFLFLTTYQSQFLWRFFEPFLKLIQFPWRFIGLALLGISFIGAYFSKEIKIPFKNWLILALCFLTIIVNKKYFTGQKIDNKIFEKKYLSQNYIENRVAYKVAEYLPKSNDYNFWRSLENKNPSKKELDQITLYPFSKNRQTTIEKIGNLISIAAFVILIIVSRKIRYNNF